MLTMLFRHVPWTVRMIKWLTISDLGLAQIYPLTDEESDTGPKVISASFADPYVLLIRDDFSAVVLTADENGDLDEVSQSESYKAGKWLSGSLYEDSNDILRLEYPEESEDEVGNVLMFLLNAKGGLQVRQKLPSCHCCQNHTF